MYSSTRIVVNSKFLHLCYRPFGGSDEGSEGGLEDVCRLSAPGSTVTTTPHPVKRATKVVVVLNGCPVRCLRRDMATDLVFEV